MRDCDDASSASNTLCIDGRKSHSDFQLCQILDEIQKSVPELKSVQANYCYFLLLKTTLSSRNKSRLVELIGGENESPFNPIQPDSVLVVPRFGTISAWSSKATDIAHRCGFSGVERVERAIYWKIDCSEEITEGFKTQIHPYIHDRMVESVITESNQLNLIFQRYSPRPLQRFDLSDVGTGELSEANLELGLALTDSELDYVRSWYLKQGRTPTDAELMMFSQVNSEHCRHKIFNASWTIDDQQYSDSMFSMIRRTHQMNPDGTLVAYEDNSAVIEGTESTRFAPCNVSKQYQFTSEPVHIVFKAETHNHPTAISPFPGAATGSGGEIRDEGATGRGGKPKAGVCGYSVSHLRVPGLNHPWEDSYRSPSRISSPLRIMLEAPIGAASFNNEFGRPNIGGYFRTFETANNKEGEWYGFHKPIMFAGGIGNIRPNMIGKKDLSVGDLLIVIGGPAMLIGLGGGAASSLGQGTSGEELDFASVQRSNPEMQRRCQEVIDRCCELGEENPILSIHDVGAGGLSNALPEIVHASNLGAEIYLDKIPNDDPGMSPMEIWCNEAQERYVMAISQANIAFFSELCERERCPFSVVGVVTEEKTLKVIDSGHVSNLQDAPVNIDMDFLMEGFLKIHRQDTKPEISANTSDEVRLPNFDQCADAILRFPSVGDKTFLITIGDRTVGGLIHRDQMVGPWQVPVADSAVTISSYDTFSGEAMAIGERSPLAVTDAVASARMAVGEALMNLRSAPVDSIRKVRMSANWMAASSVEGQGRALYDSVRSVALDMCRTLEISIPVGKDSMSMHTEWLEDEDKAAKVVSPMSLIATAFAPVSNVRKSVTPQLKKQSDTVLLLIDLGAKKDRMGMSVLHQTQNMIGCQVPDVDDVSVLKSCFQTIGELIDHELILAYHDRSDGGLFVTLCEMAFAGRTGLDIRISQCESPTDFFFNEELGAVIQVSRNNIKRIYEIFDKKGLLSIVSEIGELRSDDLIELQVGGFQILCRKREELHRAWSELSWCMQTMRDNADFALQEYDRILDINDPGLSPVLNHGLETVDDFQLQSQAVGRAAKPKVAIMREQGVNGHVEMAAAFNQAGFESYDVAMIDLLKGDQSLNEFHGMAMCGGFSFGDVLGAGRGWANSILYHNELRDMFEQFFADKNKFALGVCNGCQVMSELKSIIPGAENWPSFLRNESYQFEARLVMVEVSEGNSIFTKSMQGSYLPVAVAHGEGKATFENSSIGKKLDEAGQICLRYTDNRHQISQQYPYNPNGSEMSVAGVTNSDGRITTMMPHPERVFRSVQYSWAPENWGEYSPWIHLFRNARMWLD